MAKKRAITKDSVEGRLPVVETVKGEGRVAHVQFVQGADKQWYWRVRGGNNEIQGSGEGHPTKAGCKRAFAAFVRSVLVITAEVLVIPGGRRGGA